MKDLSQFGSTLTNVSGLATILNQRRPSQFGAPASDALVLVVSQVPVSSPRTLSHSYPGDESLDNGRGCLWANVIKLASYKKFWQIF